MMLMTEWVMKFAPIGVFGLVARVVAKTGHGLRFADEAVLRPQSRFEDDVPNGQRAAVVDVVTGVVMAVV